MIDLGITGFGNQLNNWGDVVGQVSPPSDAFLWKDDRLLDLGTLHGGGSTAVDINNRGEIVGQASGSAFLWTRETGMKGLGSLDGNPGSTSDAVAINDRGQIVGTSFSYALGTSHAVYYSPSGVIDLGTLGGYSEAKAVNNLGQVVGLSNGDAFLTDLQGGPMVDLNTLIPPNSGWVRLVEADGINDAGEIVGSGQLPGYDIIHAFLLTPEDRPAAVFVPVAPELSDIRAGFTKTDFSDGRRFDPLPHPQQVETWTGPRPPFEEVWVPRSVGVLTVSAVAGFADPFADVLTGLR
jgi:probable HAF family extracellular repeat protein